MVKLEGKENVEKVNEVENVENTETASLLQMKLVGDDCDFVNAQLAHVYREVVGAEQFGSYVEFYDEDGVVLMTAEQHEDNTINIGFGTDNDYSIKDGIVSILEETYS